MSRVPTFCLAFTWETKRTPLPFLGLEPTTAPPAAGCSSQAPAARPAWLSAAPSPKAQIGWARWIWAQGGPGWLGGLGWGGWGGWVGGVGGLGGFGGLGGLGGGSPFYLYKCLVSSLGVPNTCLPLGAHSRSSSREVRISWYQLVSVV